MIKKASSEETTMFNMKDDEHGVGQAKTRETVQNQDT